MQNNIHASHIARHIREAHFGGNWTDRNLKDLLADVTFEQAVQKVQDLNTILALTYHIHYYIKATLRVLEGGPLDANDKFSFDYPEIHSQQEWKDFVAMTLRDAEAFATLMAEIPDSQVWSFFVEEKYSSWYRNIQGVIEHTYYHMGQIAIIKKLVQK